MTWLTGIPSAWRRCAIGVNDYDYLSIVLDTLIAPESGYERRKRKGKGILERHFDLTPPSPDTTSKARHDDPASITVNGQDHVVPIVLSPGYGFELQGYFQGDLTTIFHLNLSETGLEFNVSKKLLSLGVGQSNPMSVATHDVQLLRGRTFPGDELYTRGYDDSSDYVGPSALGHLVAFTLARYTKQTDAIYSQIVIWDYVSDEIVVKIPVTVTEAYKQEDDDQADPNGLKLPIYDDEEPNELDISFLKEPRIYDCWSIRLLSDSRILVTGRNECVKFGYGHEDYTMSSAYIYSFAKDRWTLDKMMPVSCDRMIIGPTDETTGRMISQADVHIDKDEQTTIRLFGLIDTVGQDTWTNTLRIVDEDRHLNDLGDRARGFHLERPRCLGDFASAIENFPKNYPTIDCPYIAGWRAVCGSGYPVKLSANLDGEPAAGMRWTNILYYDFCPGNAAKVQALPESIKSHVRIHVQQAPYIPKDNHRYYIDGIHEPAQNDRFAEKGIGITVDTQDTKANNDRPRLPFLQIRVQAFSDMPILDVKAIAIWQGGLLLLGEKESLILYFDED